MILILGARYGFIAEHGLSPTEDEFNRARKTGTPVLVFVQNGVEREEEQDAFVKRVQGGWGEGAFTGFFSDPTELGFKVVQALTSHREAQRGSDAMPEAQQRARDLASTIDRRGSSPGNSVRVAFVPIGGVRIIDAVVLDGGTLGDAAAAVVRQHGLVSQAAGITSQVNSQGVTLQAKAPGDWHTTTVALAADGAVVVDADARAEGTMGGMAISYPRVEAISAAAGTVAHALWELLPDGDSVRQVAATASVPEADHHALVLSGQTGGSMGVPSIPSPLVAPDPALILRRADVGTQSTNRVLAVSISRRSPTTAPCRTDQRSSLKPPAQCVPAASLALDMLDAAAAITATAPGASRSAGRLPTLVSQRRCGGPRVRRARSDRVHDRA